MLPPSTTAADHWPPDYVEVFAWRQQQLGKFRGNPVLIAGAKEYYRTHPAEFINHWVDTYDPRNASGDVPARLPFVLFHRQADLIEFIRACLSAEAPGLVEKCRDMGATWVCAALSIWLWLFWPGASVGWGSRKEQLVDKIGDPDSIFEKLRMIMRGLPRIFWPQGLRPDDHMTYMKFINPENFATITGEAGDNIGRGGRKLIYFKDESAHYERPEKIEAALADNTRVQIDISSVNSIGNVFHRRRQAGTEWSPSLPALKSTTNVFVMDWSDHPAKTQEWYEERRKRAEDDGLIHIFNQEVNRDYGANIEGVIIPSTWVRAAIDAYKKLGIAPTGYRGASLDVADEGGDLNGFCGVHGTLIERIEEWSGKGSDIFWTVERAFNLCDESGYHGFKYDADGLGAGVRGDARVVNEKREQKLTVEAFRGSAGVFNPEGEDVKGRKNEDFFANCKAQAWWSLRTRFQKTFRWVAEGVPCDPDEIISIASDQSLHLKLCRELSQPTYSLNAAGKILVDKTPEGTKSPNLADAVMIQFSVAKRLPLIIPESARRWAKQARR